MPERRSLSCVRLLVIADYFFRSRVVCRCPSYCPSVDLRSLLGIMPFEVGRGSPNMYVTEQLCDADSVVTERKISQSASHVRVRLPA